MHTPAPGPAWVSNNPCQESLSAWLLFHMFFDTRHSTGLLDPNLAKGDFLAKYSRFAVQSSEKSARYMDQNARNAALSGRKVHTMHRQRSFERTGRVNRSKSAMESRQNALSNGQSELLVHASNPLRGRSVATWPNFGASLG
jgi:hypothetical protein